MENILNFSTNYVQNCIAQSVLYNSTLKLNKEDIQPEVLLNNLFADSLEFTEFLVQVEDELDVNIAITNETKTLHDIHVIIDKELKCRDN